MKQVQLPVENKCCHVVVVSEDESLLLLDDRHVKYEKENLSFTKLPELFTFEWELNKETAVSIINGAKTHVVLESDDIGNIEFKDDHYLVSISSDSVFYKGSFKINFKQ